MSKNGVLLQLTDAQDYISGEEISRRLGVSRAAVWKSIKALREEGYEIGAVTNKGYRLISSPDLLTESALLPYLDTDVLGNNIISLASVDSTNTHLKKLAVSGAAEGTAVLAESQTGGRGRMGRSFFSPEGESVYLSVLLKPQAEISRLAVLTAFSAVAVCRAIEEVCDIRPEIKWVNDVMAGGKKLCGILTETALIGESGEVSYVVIGMGVNVKQKDFPPEIRDKAVSLAQLTHGEIPRPRLAAGILNNLDAIYGDCLISKEKYLSEYRRRCATLGREIEIIRGGMTRRAYAMDIDENCGLIVRYKDGSMETLNSGEVSTSF